MGRPHRGDAEEEVWRQVDEAQGLPREGRLLAILIRLNGQPGTDPRGKAIYDFYAKKPLPYHERRVLLWHADGAARTRSSLPATVSLIQDAGGFALLDRVIRQGYVRRGID